MAEAYGPAGLLLTAVYSYPSAGCAPALDHKCGVNHRRAFVRRQLESQSRRIFFVEAAKHVSPLVPIVALALKAGRGEREVGGPVPGPCKSHNVGYRLVRHAVERYRNIRIAFAAFGQRSAVAQ